MNFEQLERFVAVAKYGSFTRAASSVFLNTSTLSKSIADLEESLGAQLFLRNRQNVTLTDCGEVLYNSALEILERMHRAEDEIKNTASQFLGRLTIINFPLESPRLVEILREYNRRYPRDEIIARRTVPGTQLQKLLDFDGDIAVVLRNDVDMVKIRRDLRTHYMESSGKRVLIDINSPLTKKEVITIDDLRDYPIFYTTYESETADKYVGIQSKNECLKFFDESFDLCPVDTQETLLMRVKLGLGVALSAPFSDSIYGNLITSRPLQTESGHDAQDDVLLVWDSNNTNPALQRLVSILPEFEIEEPKPKRQKKA